MPPGEVNRKILGKSSAKLLRKGLAYAKILAMSKTPTHLLIEQKLGRDLSRFVRTKRRSGTSWEAIARELHEQTAVPVSSESLRNWFGKAAA